MSSLIETALSGLRAIAGQGVSHHEFRGGVCVVVPPDRLHPCLSALKGLGFDFLTDITAVDYLEYEGAIDRFGVLYLLTSTSAGERLTVKTFVNPPQPTLPTVTGLWAAADWLEREVTDMFGIRFDGHPDPRRLLMPDEFVDFPLRKDYPLKGLGERHNFPVVTRAES